MSEPLKIDALIVGGGCAGLFALNSIRKAGLSALLVEQHSLGHGQTTSSQGILHAGVKYSLGGQATEDARQAGEAAAHWMDMLDGKDVDLRQVRVLARQCHLWRTASWRGAAGLLGAKLALRTRPQALPEEDRPDWLSDVGGELLTLDETVIDPRSLLEVLAKAHSNLLLKGRLTGVSPCDAGVDIHIESDRSELVRARHLILAAGVGNQDVLGLASIQDTPMQSRPLRQAMIRGALPMVFGHCIDGSKTRVTITSDSMDGPEDVVWQVGGQVAEDGANMGEPEFATHAMREIRKCVPSLSFSGCSFASYRILRAEPSMPGGARPARAFARASGRVTTLWPVKLVLAPLAADNLARQLRSGIPHALEQAHWPSDSPRPSLARRPWETARWSPLPC